MTKDVPSQELRKRAKVATAKMAQTTTWGLIPEKRILFSESFGIADAKGERGVTL
jgi:hypothetical protein